ncbi:unnamed protein product [Phytophthora lilii]|uniref:Unnamed protein product n=1 Tax=Phytophthora lilii TaxID=2077276 RepID=A0A9W6THA3_9STRA|nr:unnamed protein product [Phytophthora lilii]
MEISYTHWISAAFFRLSPRWNGCSKEYAAFALGWLAHSETICEFIISCGAIAPLVILVQSGTDDQKKQAALALGNLTVDSTDSTAAIFVNQGAVPPLVALVTGAIPHLVEVLRTGVPALLTLGYLGATNKTNSKVIREAGAFGLMLDLLRADATELKENAVSAFEHLTAHNNDNLKTLAREGIIALLISLLRTGTDVQKEPGASILGRLASTKPNRETIVDERAIPLLVEMLWTGTNDQKEEAASVLSRLAKENTSKEEIKVSGAIDALKDIQQMGTSNLKRKAGMALKTISEGGEAGTKRRR